MIKLKDKVKTLISKGKTDQAIEELLTFLKKGDTKLYNQVAGLSGQYYTLLRDIKQNLSNDTISLNRIANALLDICDELNDKEELNSSNPKSATTRSNEAKIKYKLKMEKRICKDFIDPNASKELGWKRLSQEPYLRFKFQEVMIISVDNTTYPDFEEKEGISSHFVTYPYCLYHNGIEFCITAGIGGKVIMDKDGFWEDLYDSYDTRQKDKQYIVLDIHRFARIPYWNIVDYKLDGDEYTDMPMIYCKFNYDGAPYEEIVYRTKGEFVPWVDLDKSKMTKFDKLLSL